MSMRNYAVDEYGLLMTEEMLKTIVEKTYTDYTEEQYNEDSFEFHYDLYERGIVEYISEFTGESIEIDNDGCDIWQKSENYSCDIVYFVPVKQYSTLFCAAYRNMGQIVHEFKMKFDKYFPDDFDYRSHIRHIVGTYYG